MTIDKMYISYQMTKSEFKDARDRLNAYFKGTRNVLRWDKGNQSYLTHGFSDYGFQEIRLRKLYSYYGIEIRLRPEILLELDGTNYYGLTQIKDFKGVATNFDYILKDIVGLTVPKFFEWMVKRIEFTIDIFTGEQLLPMILQLIKRGNIPTYMLEDKKGITKKYFDSVTNVYLYSKTITVQWYDRYKTIREKDKKSKKDYKSYECTKGILRFEVQCKDCNKKVRNVLSVDLFKEKVWFFHNLIVGPGDYYTLESAMKIIREKVKDIGKREKLIRFIILIDKSGSVWGAKKQFPKQLEFSSGTKSLDKIMDTFSRRLCQIRELGVNPVCLPPEWGIEELGNLEHNIREYMERIIRVCQEFCVTSQNQN